MKIRCTIDINEVDDNVSEMGSLETGVYGCDKEGLYHKFYGSRSDLITFKDIEIIEHDPPKTHCNLKDCYICELEKQHKCSCCGDIEI